VRGGSGTVVLFVSLEKKKNPKPLRTDTDLEGVGESEIKGSEG